jgi:hypothetical protein
MKPYGIPRVPELEFPDVGDIQKFAMPSRAGRIAREDRIYKSYIRGSAKRQAARRYWKKKAHNAGKREVYNEN